MGVKVTHRGTEIEYCENSNQWVFELRGRERKVESLRQAKEAIDKPPPKEKNSKPFERIKAYYRDMGKTFVEVEVTSIADPGRYSREHEVWCYRKGGTRLHGDRFKEHASSIYPATPDNAEKIKKITSLNEQIETLEEKALGIIGTLEHLVIPKDETA